MLQCFVKKFSLALSTVIALARFFNKSSHISGISKATGFACFKIVSSFVQSSVLSGSYKRENMVSSFCTPSKTFFHKLLHLQKGCLRSVTSLRLCIQVYLKCLAALNAWLLLHSCLVMHLLHRLKKRLGACHPFGNLSN